MESSTSNTFRPLNSLAITLTSDEPTIILRTPCPGMMNVRPYVAVFHKTFAVRNTQQTRQLSGAGTAGSGIGIITLISLGWHRSTTRLARALPRLSVLDNTEYRPAQSSDVPADTNSKTHGLKSRPPCASAGMHGAVQRDEHRLSGLNIAFECVGRSLQCDWIHCPPSRCRLAAADRQRTNPVRIAKCRPNRGRQSMRSRHRNP